MRWRRFCLSNELFVGDKRELIELLQPTRNWKEKVSGPSWRRFGSSANIHAHIVRTTAPGATLRRCIGNSGPCCTPPSCNPRTRFLDQFPTLPSSLASHDIHEFNLRGYRKRIKSSLAA